MSSSPEMLTALQELATAKQLDRAELMDLLKDGIQAALVRAYGPTVKFELNADEIEGTLQVLRLRQVVEDLVPRAPAFDEDMSIGSKSRIVVEHSGRDLKPVVTCFEDWHR